MLIIGHRGACGYEPENTLSSFEKAIELTVDMVEFDVYVLKTGELIVFHDRRLERTTNGRGNLLDHTFAELRQLDAGKGQQIPTLEEVLERIDRRKPVNIELKNPGTAKPVAELIERYVQKHGWRYDQFVVSSFHHPELYAFKKTYAPHIQVAALTGTIPLHNAQFGEELGAFAVSPDIECLDQVFIDDAHARGLKVFVYTIGAFDDAVTMQRMGVDGIFSNYPDISRAAITPIHSRSKSRPWRALSVR